MTLHSDASPGREPIRTREAGWSSILVFLAVSAGVLLLVLLLQRHPAGRFLTGPGWWENLSTFVLLLGIAVGGVIFGMARLRPVDLGLRRSGLAEGVLVTLAIWGLIQLFVAVPVVLTGGTLVLSPAWSSPGVGRTLLWAAVMFGATALYEEIGFRGFLFPQLYLKLRGSHRMRFWTALLGSQLLFASAHIPAHVLIRGYSTSTLVQMGLLQGFAGVLMLLVYLRTRNLWIAVGLHGLVNAPTPLFSESLPWEYYLFGLLIVWPWLMRRPAHRGLARVERVERPDGERPELRPRALAPTPV